MSAHSLYFALVTRSAPLPVEQRRREIVEAVIPLFEEEGFLVSTRRIADAAGIAEGTIFRVFPSKAELMRAVIHSYVDPSDAITQLGAIDPNLPLPDKIAFVIGVVQESALRIHSIMMSVHGRLRNHIMPHMGRHLRQTADGLVHRLEIPDDQPGETPTNREDFHPFIDSYQALGDAIEKVLADHQSELSVNTPTAASYILTTGILHLIANAVPNPIDPVDFVALTVRALIRKETE